LTFVTLTNILIKLKEFLNIDDNRVYAYGHSDGSDGVFGFDVYRPSLFAGFVGYNSMLNQLSGDVYLKNMINKPFYLVHSDLDDLRPIQQTRLQIQELDSIKAPVLYKEYIGYKHEDKHLEIDRPNSLIFLNATTRNPFPKALFWETDNTSFNSCEWLKITQLNPLDQKKEWQKEINSMSYNKLTKEYLNIPYYNYNNSGNGAVIAYYDNNIFKIQTSRVSQIELLISPVMVNLLNPLIVIINGKTVFNKRIEPDKDFMINNFKHSFDREALWVTSIKLQAD